MIVLVTPSLDPLCLPPFCRCVFTQGYQSDCGIASGPGWQVHDNQVFSANGSLQVCGSSFKAYQAQGHDEGSTLAKWPSDDALVAMGKKVLGMSA